MAVVSSKPGDGSGGLDDGSKAVEEAPFITRGCDDSDGDGNNSNGRRYDDEDGAVSRTRARAVSFEL